eukprot:4651980-Alexandrium_andersonii.AAC.1
MGIKGEEVLIVSQGDRGPKCAQTIRGGTETRQLYGRSQIQVTAWHDPPATSERCNCRRARVS